MAHNARFWTYINGPVKLKLRPGQVIHHWSGGPTDEGYNSENDTWEHCGDHVKHSWFVDGRDCDGRLSQGGEKVATLDELAAGHVDDLDGIAYPLWELVESSQRDYSTEAAGY